MSPIYLKPKYYESGSALSQVHAKPADDGADADVAVQIVRRLLQKLRRLQKLRARSAAQKWLEQHWRDWVPDERCESYTREGTL